jgi:hypothetical protein
VATKGEPVMSYTSGTLTYWNTHTGFGEIELDSEYRRVGIYRADLLRAGVKAPQVGDRFHISTGAAYTPPNKRRSRLFDFRGRNR